jgi:adenosylhomocysteine nucleosidase
MDQSEAGGLTRKGVKPALGLVVAMPLEAWTLLGCSRWRDSGGRLCQHLLIEEDTYLLSVRSGPGMANALSASRWLVRAGVTALAGIGVSGGLDPNLRTGDVIVAETVLEETHPKRELSWKPPPLSLRWAEELLAAQEIRIHQGAIITTPEAVTSPVRKRSLFDRTGASAVDMESASVARAAAEAGLPFFVMRTICDTADRFVSPDFVDCLDREGMVRLPALVKNAWQNPSLLFELARVGREFATALRCLKRAWRALLRHGFPQQLARPQGEDEPHHARDPQAKHEKVP